MVNTLIGLSGCATALAALGAVAFYICILVRHTGVTENKNASYFCRLLLLARICSILFAAGGWLAATCAPWDECLMGYQALGQYCSLTGEGWFSGGLIFMLCTLLLSMVPRDDSERSRMWCLCTSALFTGLIFEIAAVLLTGA